MKRKKVLIILGALIIAALLMLGSAFIGIILYKKTFVEPIESEPKDSESKYAEQVSMLQLLTAPEKYDGKLVLVKGVGNLEFEGDCISLSKDDLKYHTGNSIWIELDESCVSYEDAKQYNGEYVYVEGVFDKDYGGHMNGFCGSIREVSRYELYDLHLWLHSHIGKSDNNTYSYEVSDYNNRVLASEEGLATKPEREYVNTDTIGISIQAGTGLSTKRTTYFDLENSRVSETFYYVLSARDDYVIYANYENGKHSIEVQDIFDRSVYYQVYELENVSPVAADFTVECKQNDDGSVTVTYLAGEDYTKTDLVINIP